MSASHPQAHDAPRGDSILSTRTKQAGRALLAPIVRLALALHITANMVTVFGLFIVVAATVLVATGNLLIGALAIISVLAVATTVQRIWHVYRLTSATPRGATTTTQVKENEQGG